MRFLGGKYRIAKYLAPIILNSASNKILVEPFCGGLHVTTKLLQSDPEIRIYASDIHDDLVDMWVALQQGWVPPRSMTRERREDLRHGPSCPDRTFAGYGCSFGGGWFTGFAEDSTGRDYCLNAHNSLVKIAPLLSRVTFSHGSYETQNLPEDCVIYCDPPYAATTRPGARGSFDHEVFWQWVRMSKQQCFVSEYTAPSDMTEVWSKAVHTDMNTTTGRDARVERLFVNHFC